MNLSLVQELAEQQEFSGVVRIMVSGETVGDIDDQVFGERSAHTYAVLANTSSGAWPLVSALVVELG